KAIATIRNDANVTVDHKIDQFLGRTGISEDNMITNPQLLSQLFQVSSNPATFTHLEVQAQIGSLLTCFGKRTNSGIQAVALGCIPMIHKDKWTLLTGQFSQWLSTPREGKESGISAIEDAGELLCGNPPLEQEFFKRPADRHNMMGKTSGNVLLPCC